jgi:hypothetical protein
MLTIYPQLEGQDDLETRDNVTHHTILLFPRRDKLGVSVLWLRVRWSEYIDSMVSSRFPGVDAGVRGCVLSVVLFE